MPDGRFQKIHDDAFAAFLHPLEANFFTDRPGCAAGIERFTHRKP